ncbi:MAG: hypothetical protein J0L79_05870 [Rickettsiales bacterium]|nr:hypothetical protein [Rickettsiales bacterium]MCA0254768.1 hypothetical protein [Pseudomonadota bacterium]
MYTKSMIISGEEQNPLKCLSNLEETWNGIALIFYLLTSDSKPILNRCDRTKSQLNQSFSGN